MSTATEITRLATARDTIRDKMVDLGLSTSTSKLDALATAVDGIVNRGAVSATVMEGDTYTIPRGYHNGSGTVSGVAGGGNYSLQSKVVTPTKSQQNITPDSGYYGMDSVTVNAIPEAYQNVSSVTATASDVLSPKVFANASGNVVGTMVNNGAVTRTLDTAAGNSSYTIPAGYHNGNGTVSITTETKTATPSESSQTITPTTGKVLSSVTVNPIPSNYKDATSADALPGEVLSGKVFVNINGRYTGSMPNNGTVSETLDTREGHTSYTIPEGYHNGNGTVSIPISANALSVIPSDEEQTFSTTVVNDQTGTAEVYESIVVDAIPSNYVDVTETDVVPGDVAEGVYFAGQNGVEEGTLPVFSYGSTDPVYLYPETGHTSYTIPHGIHTGEQEVRIDTETKTATPTTSGQNITATSGKVLSSVIVSAIPTQYKDTTNTNAVAADVLYGKTFVNTTGKVTGSMTNNGAVSKTLDATSNNQSYTVPAGYHNGSGTVSITLETKSATPSTSSQNITPTSGKVLSQVTVNAIPAKYGDTTGDTAVAANLLSGIKAHTIVNGTATQITGSMANNGSLSATIDGLTTTSYTLTAGYYSGGSVSLTSDIEDALAAI